MFNLGIYISLLNKKGIWEHRVFILVQDIFKKLHAKL